MNATLIKFELKALILCFAKADVKISMSLDIDNSISDEKNPTYIAKLIGAKDLFDVIEEYKSPIKSVNRVTDLDTPLSKEIDLFTSGGGRGEYLQAAHS